MNFNKFSTLVASVTMATAIGLSGVANAADDVVKLRWASFVSPKSTNNAVSVPNFAKAIEKASEGTLKIELFAGGTLGKSPVQQLTMVENGVSDIAEVVVAYSPGRFPELSMFELPFLTDNNVNAGMAAWELYEKKVLSDFDELMLVGIIVSGPYGISANKPITSVADLKGLRLRAAGPIQNDMVTALGAVPVGNISAPSIAENISKGLIDGTLMAPGNLYNFRITDAATHHNFDLKLGSVAVIFPMRRDTYKKLPPKAKAAFDKFGGKWMTRELGKGLDVQEANAIAKMKSESDRHTIYKWSEEQIAEAKAKLAPVVEKYNVKNANGVNVFQEVQGAFETVKSGN